jgi:CelD/BcsL family acetyltransferase involved in cellulose biosynthesis
MSIRLYSWHEAQSELRTDWAGLVSALKLNPSLHPDWLNISVSSKGMAERCHVASVSAAGGNVAFVPIVLRSVTVAGVPVRCLDLCSNMMSYHAELVTTGAHEQVLAELLSSTLIPEWDAFRLQNLPVSGLTTAAVTAVTGQQSFAYAGERSPYFDMPGSWEEFLRTLPKKMRANIKGCIRSTQEAGETDMKWYEQGSDEGLLLDDILNIESRSWKAADNKAIRADAAEGDYYRQLLPWLAANGLQANVLYVKHQPAAYVLCARWQGWVGQLKTSFAMGIRDAGFRVIQASIERAFTNRQNEYDFLGDAAPHKLRWASQVRIHEDRWIFARHWRGLALATLKRGVDALHRAHSDRRPAVPV